VAVYTPLDELALRALWSVYDDERELLSARGIAAGSINTTYRLETEAGVFYLRINEQKTTDEVFYERDLLDRLAQRALGGVVTPVIRRTRIGGSFFHLEERQTPGGPRPVWAAIFAELPGRDVGVFELEPAHTAQIGAFLARAHRALRDFRRGRRNPFGLPVVRRWLADMGPIAAAGPLGAVARRLSRSVEQIARRRRLLPRGVIHGDLFVDNTKWQRGALQAVFDWEMAGRDHLALDLAICLHAWCFTRASGEGAFDPARCQALVAAYQAVRPLQPSERRGLFDEARLAAVRFTASRIRDFELPRADRVDREGAHRSHLDFRDFLARLDALEGMGESGFRALVGLQGSQALRRRPPRG
jgi:homoserine kinase type II